MKRAGLEKSGDMTQANDISVELKLKDFKPRERWWLEKAECWECKMVQMPWKIVCQFLIELNMQPPYALAVRL